MAIQRLHDAANLSVLKFGKISNVFNVTYLSAGPKHLKLRMSVLMFCQWVASGYLTNKHNNGRDDSDSGNQITSSIQTFIFSLLDKPELKQTYKTTIFIS